MASISMTSVTATSETATNINPVSSITFRCFYKLSPQNKQEISHIFSSRQHIAQKSVDLIPDKNLSAFLVHGEDAWICVPELSLIVQNYCRERNLAYDVLASSLRHGQRKKAPEPPKPRIIRIAESGSEYHVVKEPERKLIKAKPTVKVLETSIDEKLLDPILAKRTPTFYLIGYDACEKGIPDSPTYGIKLLSEGDGKERVVSALAYEEAGVWEIWDPTIQEMDVDLDPDDDVDFESIDPIDMLESIDQEPKLDRLPRPLIDNPANNDGGVLSLVLGIDDRTVEQHLDGSFKPLTWRWKTIRDMNELFNVNKDAASTRQGTSSMITFSRSKHMDDSVVAGILKEDIPTFSRILRYPGVHSILSWNGKVMRQLLLLRMKAAMENFQESYEIYHVLKFKIGTANFKGVGEQGLQMPPKTFAEMPFSFLNTTFTDHLPWQLYQPMVQILKAATDPTPTKTAAASLKYDFVIQHKTHEHSPARAVKLTLNASDLVVSEVVRDEGSIVGYPHGLADVRFVTVGGKTDGRLHLKTQTKLRHDVKPFKQFHRNISNFVGSNGPGVVFDQIPGFCEVVTATMRRSAGFQFGNEFVVTVSKVTDMIVEHEIGGASTRRKITPKKSDYALVDLAVQIPHEEDEYDTDRTRGAASFATLDASNTFCTVEIKPVASAWKKYMKGKMEVDVVERMMLATTWLGGIVDRILATELK